MMKENKLRMLLDQGKPSISTRMWSTWPGYLESLGNIGGFDYFEFVAEYVAFSQEKLENLARTAELLSAVRLEFQAEQDKARTGKQRLALSEHTLHQKEPVVLSDGSRAEVPKTASQGQGGECLGQEPTSTALEHQRTRSRNDEIKTATEDRNLCEAITESAPSSHLNSEQQISRNNTEGGT